MLDSDVAMAYGTTAKRINEAVSRNPERFPEDFVFQLTKKEAEACGFDFEVPDWNLKTDGELVAICDQFSTRKHRPKSYRPYGFTREGCNMLATVLRTPAAVERAIVIIRAFSARERGETGAMGILR